MVIKRALLDTNIVIHRESDRLIKDEIGFLFRWFDELGITKTVHPVSVAEIEKYEDETVVESFRVKISSYNVQKTVATLHDEVQTAFQATDASENDRNDTILLNGFRLGERFLKIIFDNALMTGVDEVYITIFDRSLEHERLIALLQDYGFHYHGKKTTTAGSESVYVRPFAPSFDSTDPKSTFPYLSTRNTVFLVPIWPDYHTDLLPDSILRTESPDDFTENEPFRNAISGVRTALSGM